MGRVTDKHQSIGRWILIRSQVLRQRTLMAVVGQSATAALASNQSVAPKLMGGVSAQWCWRKPGASIQQPRCACRMGRCVRCRNHLVAACTCLMEGGGVEMSSSVTILTLMRAFAVAVIEWCVPLVRLNVVAGAGLRVKASAAGMSGIEMMRTSSAALAGHTPAGGRLARNSGPAMRVSHACVETPPAWMLPSFPSGLEAVLIARLIAAVVAAVRTPNASHTPSRSLALEMQAILVIASMAWEATSESHSTSPPVATRFVPRALTPVVVGPCPSRLRVLQCKHRLRRSA